MSEKASYIRLGVFVFIGTVLLIIGIFYIGNKQALFSPTYSVRASFNNIEGLRVGAPVWLSGINVGSVSNISLKQDNSGRVEVAIRLLSDVKDIIRTNTEAWIETEGLVGNKVLILKLGSTDAPLVKENDYIIGVDPMGLAVIVGEIRSVLQNTQGMTKYLTEIVQKVNEGDGTIGKLLNDDELYRNLNTLLSSANKGLISATGSLDTLSVLMGSMNSEAISLFRGIDRTIADVDLIIKDIRSGKGVLGSLISGESPMNDSVNRLLGNVIVITEEVKLGASRFAENMEALKRNWLFRSYFEERGYYDKSGYEMKLDEQIKEVDAKIKLLEERISTLKELEKRSGHQ